MVQANRTYHFDYRGSTVVITDFAGKVKERIEYSSYGRITQRTGSTTDTPFLFGGEAGVETDANGLYYMHARYYNPHLRRFINADPAGLAGGMNFYAYADGDPISMIDPSGLGATPADRNDQIRKDFMTTYNQKQAETAAIWYTGVQGGSAPPMTGRQMLDTALSFTPGGEAVKALYTQYTYKELGTGAWSQRTDSEIFWQGIEGTAQLAVSLPAAGKALGAVKVPSQPLFIGGKVAGGGAFRPFTKSNYRYNLQVLTGQTGKGMDAHHIYPKADRFKSQFERVGINVHDPKNMTWWKSKPHRTAAASYNKAWDDFFEATPNASANQVKSFGRSLMKQHGF